MQFTEADLVWNRAALEGGGATARKGDLALAALLLVHGAICNGGVCDACESLSPTQLVAGGDAYAFFGLPDVAKVLSTPPDASDDECEHADRDYWQLVPDDATLVARFEAVFAQSRDLFADV